MKNEKPNFIIEQTLKCKEKKLYEHPGGNQVDGLPPVSSASFFQMKSRKTGADLDSPRIMMPDILVISRHHVVIFLKSF